MVKSETAGQTREARPQIHPSPFTLHPALLEVRGLRVQFRLAKRTIHAVNDVSFTLAAGSVMGLVGESGCGKSVTALSLMGLLEAPGEVTGGPAILHWRIFFDQPAIFLFALLFLWQLPHFLAINWMYREEYIRGGFVMWSNDDESGAKTSRRAIFYSVLLMLLAVHPWWAGFASPWFTVLALLAGGWLVFLAVKFHALRDRASARRLFLNTLLYLPIVLVSLCLLARIVPHPQP